MILRAFLRYLDRLVPAEIASAHCDVPCGLYTADAAVLAADTVLKMAEKIAALTADASGRPRDDLSVQDRHTFVRMVWTKEEHARKCKEELLILWTDFFKPEHLSRFPDLHETFWRAAKLCSRAKQEVSVEAARELRDAVERIAAIVAEVKRG